MVCIWGGKACGQRERRVRQRCGHDEGRAGASVEGRRLTLEAMGKEYLQPIRSQVEKLPLVGLQSCREKPSLLLRHLPPHDLRPQQAESNPSLPAHLQRLNVQQHPVGENGEKLCPVEVVVEKDGVWLPLKRVLLEPPLLGGRKLAEKLEGALVLSKARGWHLAFGAGYRVKQV